MDASKYKIQQISIKREALSSQLRMLANKVKITPIQKRMAANIVGASSFALSVLTEIS
jgi:hypothetical protein